MLHCSRLLSIVAAGTLLMLVPASASAQDRTGVSFGVGAGVGWADATCDSCDFDGGREIGPSLYANFGYSRNPHLVGGIEVKFWGKTQDEAFGEFSLGLLNVNGTFQYYPSATGGAWVKGGLGFSRAAVKLLGLGVDRVDRSDLGWGYSAGAGYDIPFGPIHLTPAVNYWGGQIDEFEGLQGWRHSVAEITLGITFP
jgi:hypothetical protein